MCRYLLLGAFSHSHKVVLKAERAAGVGGPQILSVRLQPPLLGIARQVPRQDLLAQPLVQIRLGYRKQDLASFHKISRHPVGASAVDLLLAAVSKTEDPAMLQKPPDDAPHPDPLAPALHPRPQRTHPAYDQVDLDARLRGRIQRLYRSPI